MEGKFKFSFAGSSSKPDFQSYAGGKTVKNKILLRNTGQGGAKLSKAVQCYNSLKGKLRVKDGRRRRRRRTRRQN